MPSREPLFQRVAIIGLGLIGGSLAGAIRKHGLAHEVVAADQRKEDLLLGESQGVIDTIAQTVAEAVQGADLVVLAVPVQATRKVLEEIRPHLAADAILTDVGSTKSGFVKDVEAVFGEFCPVLFRGIPLRVRREVASVRLIRICSETTKLY